MKKPRITGAFSSCAEEDSNLHGLLAHKALKLESQSVDVAAADSSLLMFGRRT